MKPEEQAHQAWTTGAARGRGMGASRETGPERVSCVVRSARSDQRVLRGAGSVVLAPERGLF